MQDSYLLKSLFQESININALTDKIFSFDHHLSKFSGMIFVLKHLKKINLQKNQLIFYFILYTEIFYHSYYLFLL